MKAMTLMEAWKEVPLKHTIGVEDAFAHGFASGRLGMKPEDEAVRIPDVAEWPAEAQGFWANFTELTEGQLCEDQPDVSKFGIGTYIPRPTPQWTPKVGEAVFCRTGSGIDVCVVNVFSNGCANVQYRLGDFVIDLKNMKPFDPAYIGKPWDEIPGGK
jgi:hypothetical protein